MSFQHHKPRQSSWTRVTAAAAASVVTMTMLASAADADGSAGASDVIARTWGTNGRVLDILTVGGQVVIGGDFTQVVNPDGDTFPADHIAKFDPQTGLFDTSWSLGTNGEVTSLEASGDTLYVGGGFSQVNGETHKSLFAASLSTGSVLPMWTGATDMQVDAMAVTGGFVYVGGPFTSVTDASGIHSAPYLARLNSTTGDYDASWSATLTARTRSLLSSVDGSKIYVGGDFTFVNGVGYAGKLTALSTADASIDPVFRGGTTNLNYRSPVYHMVTDGTSLLVGASGSGGGCTLLDAGTGSTIWSKHANGDVVGVAMFGPLSYCGGHFSGGASFDGVDRYKLAAVQTQTGTLSSYAPVVNSALGVWSIGSTADALLIGGDFTKVGNTSQWSFGMFKDTTAVTRPQTPSSVTGRAGDHQSLVTWRTPSSDGGTPILSFQILRSENGSPLTEIGRTSQPSFVDTSARNDHTYTYRVVATNAVGASDQSAAVQVTPRAGLMSVPGVPKSFVVTGGFGSSALSWARPTSDGGSPITTYRIFRSTTTGQEQQLTDVPGTATSYSDSDVSMGVRYYYQVAAVNAAGLGPLTSEKSAVPDTGVPARPVLSVTATSPRITLGWTLPSEGAAPVTKFIITRGSVRLVTLTNGSLRSYIDTTAAHGGTYVYQIKAYNSYGWSSYSNSVTATAP